MRKIHYLSVMAAVAALLTATATALGAQETGGRTADYTGTHEIELSVGLPAPQFATSLLGMTRGFMNILDMTGDMLGAAAGDGTTAPACTAFTSRTLSVQSSISPCSLPTAWSTTMT